MTGIDEVLPAPRRIEIDTVYLHAPIERVWDRVRHGDLATSPLVRALFAVRDIPRRLAGERSEPFVFTLDALGASGAPGFRVLVDHPREEVVVGAIGKVWMPDIPYVDAPDTDTFRSFEEPGFVKVAWAVRVTPLSATLTRLVLELRVDATDVEAWEHFVTYFRVVGPASRFIRKTLLRELESELGAAWSSSEQRPARGRALAAGRCAALAIDHDWCDAGAHLAVARPDGVRPRRLLCRRPAGQRRRAQRPGSPPGSARAAGR